MPDVYASITEVDESIQEQIAGALEIRAADPQQRAMLQAYLDQLQLNPGAHALEIGCGTGAICRVLAQQTEIKQVLGIDPSSIFIERARELSKDHSNLSFMIGDGRSLNLEDGSFDLIVFHTVLCHVPEPERALREAYRLLRPSGSLAVFDGDYTTTTVALNDDDPLQTAVEAMIANYVNDKWLARRLPKMVGSEGFSVERFQSHGYTQTTEPSYMMTIVDRGIDVLTSSGMLRQDQSDALRAEARRRVDCGEFFGHISFVSLIARKLS